jgi:diguanylate cyclase (GGDEF)-like protein/PAS domain S-box-containing protein
VKSLDTIEHWRNKVFSALLTYVVAFGVLTAIPSAALAIKTGLWSVAAVDVGAVAAVVAIWRFKSINYTLRVLVFLSLNFLLGITLMVTVGSISQIYLFAAPVLATVLLGTVPAIIALGLAALTVFLLAALGLAKLHMDGVNAPGILTPLIITLNFLFVGALMTGSSAVLLRGLSRSLHRLARFADSLTQGKSELQVLNAELRLTAAAVARLNDLLLIAKVADGPGAPHPLIFVNEAFEQRTGYRRDEVMGLNVAMLLGADPDSPQARKVARAMANIEPVTAELRYLTKTGEPYWVELEMVPFADEGGQNTHWVAVGRDITERKKSDRRIYQLAFFDVLTGLPNRRLLVDRLEERLMDADGGGDLGALLFVDLDRFKYVNDARGHAVGDAILIQAAERLSAVAGDHNLVARIGGDEFVLLMNNLGRDQFRASAAALAMADKVRQALADGFEIEGQRYTSSASIGVTLLPKVGHTAHDLLREADTAMYRAKLAGRNRIAMFEATMQAEVEQRLSMERDLAAALENGELSMHLQLQVDRNGKPSGAELLARWRRADGSFVPPDQFIPVAEECGLIVPLGRLALRAACSGLRRLAQAGYQLPLSVNVSPSQFRQPDFVDQVCAILAETGAPAGQLIFEVTEGLFIEDLDGTLMRMHELATLGIRLSIDDFGTGYSSLSYLKRMPLYELKIDRSFIRDTPGDANGTAIVQSILAMASHLGLRVIAEGVETQEQARFLSANGAESMQGYLFARPMPLEDMISLLDAHPSGFHVPGANPQAAAVALG